MARRIPRSRMTYTLLPFTTFFLSQPSMPRRDGQCGPVPWQGEAAQRGPGPGRRDRRAGGREAMIEPPDQGKDCVLAWEAMPHALPGNLTRPQAEWLDRHLARCAPRRGQFAQEQGLQLAWKRPGSETGHAAAGLQHQSA